MIKIDTIKIKGFKKIKASTVELSLETNLFLGHNATGKTSLQDAIRYALTDSIQGQPKGAFVEAVNDQCKTASIVITGQAGTSPFNIKRTLAKTNRSGLSPVQVGSQLSVDPDILSACLDANYYFDLPPAEQKKLLIKALGLKPTLRDAYLALVQAGSSENVCQEFWNEGIIKEIASLGWDAGYKMAYGKRREAGQEIKTLNGNQPQLITQVAMDGEDVPVSVIEKSNKDKPLSKQEEAHKARLNGLYEELGGIKALSETDKKEAEKQLAEYQAELTRIKEQPQWTGEDSAKAKQLKIAKKKIDTKNKEDITTLESLSEAAEKTLANSKRDWKSDLKCPISDKSGHKMCPAVEPDWSKQQEDINGLETKIKKIEEKGFPDQDRWDALAEKATVCKDNITNKKILEKDIKELEEKLENAAPEAGEKKEAFEISIADLEKKVKHLGLAQSALTWNQATQKTLDTTGDKIDEAEAKYKHYDTLCVLLSPSGIPGELVAKKLGGLNDRLKEHSEMMSVEIMFLDDLSLVQADKKQLWVLGGAEQARVKMAVAEAISHVTEVGLLLLDECNVSVSDDSARVRSWLTEIGKSTQILAAAATNAAGPPNVPENSPVRIFWVEDGSFKKLGE